MMRDFAEMDHPRRDEVDRLVYHMPTVAQMAKTDWVKGFAKSIMHQSKRSGWKPSTKQLGLMRELVSDLFTYDGGDFDLIDRGES